MNVTSRQVDLGHLRCHLFEPVHRTVQRWPGVLLYSDIFQQTGPHQRVCARLASHGFVVVSPELYGRSLPPGTALRFEEDRELALRCSAALELTHLDEDQSDALGVLSGLATVDGERLFTAGFCIGGHLAFRAALDPRIKAAACFYATGLHSSELGAASGTATTLARARELKAELLLVWGTRDPHIPPEGRALIHSTLSQAQVPFQVALFDAEHAFVRDEGARWNPAAGDEAFAGMVRFFKRWL